MSGLDVVTMDAVSLESSAVLFRDCSFPITDARKYCPPDDVLLNFPTFIGEWENNTLAPAIRTQEITVDTTDVVDACDTAVVSGALTSCSLVAPNQKKIKLRTETLDWTELRSQFCRQRNISTAQLGMVILPNGQFDMGNPYVIDFARFAMAQVARAMMQIISDSVLNGDYSNPFEVDGLYNQLTYGWGNPQTGTPCPAAINVRQTINWSTLTGGNGSTPASPDAVTTAQNVTLWGVSRAVPAGLNLAEFLETLWFDAVERNYADAAGGVSMWEAHVPFGAAHCFLSTAACMQPCQVTGDFDPEIRERYRRMRQTKIAELYPSGRSFPMMESRGVDANTMWIGPREIGGRPTYGVFFWNLNRYFASLGGMSNVYGKSYGMPPEEPLLPDLSNNLNVLPLESIAFQQDVIKTSIDCLQFAMMAYYGVLVAARHLWLEITQVACQSFVDACDDDITIIEPEPEEPEGD